MCVVRPILHPGPLSAVCGVFQEPVFDRFRDPGNRPHESGGNGNPLWALAFAPPHRHAGPASTPLHPGTLAATCFLTCDILPAPSQAGGRSLLSTVEGSGYAFYQSKLTSLASQFSPAMPMGFTNFYVRIQVCDPDESYSVLQPNR